ncbi:MAG: hypothetical protein QM669_01315 [Siphonobacter sp.]
MKKKLFLYTLLVLATGCGKSKETPISEQIQKVWIPNIVKEGTTTVYTRGATSNIRAAYQYFKLDLSTAGKVTLTTVDQNSFTGTWALSSDNTTLTLSDLTPEPTGTSGTIVYTVTGTPSSTQLHLTSTTADLKTGNTINDYQLIPQ